MEIRILKDEKDLMEFEVIGEDHTFCNLLRSELWKLDNTNFAGYSILHTLISAPKFCVSTENGKPRKVLLDAAVSVRAKVKDMKGLLKNLQ